MASISPTTLSCPSEPHSGKKSYLKLTITEITQTDGATNKTTVKWKITAHNSWSTLYRAYCSLGGKVLYDGKPEKTNWSDGWELASGTTTFDNNSDGSLVLSAYLKQMFYYGNGVASRWENPSIYQDASTNMTCSQIPRYAAFTAHYVAGIDENNVAITWNTDVACDSVQYSLNDGAWTNGAHPTYYVGNLAANTDYKIRTRIKRADSQLWTESGYLYFKTYNYPHCTKIPNFKIGENPTAEFYNPLGRTFEIQLWSARSRQFVSDRITVTGTSYSNFSGLADRLYASIPNHSDSGYNIDVWYGNNKAVKEGGMYYIKGNEIPTFSESNIIDVVETLHVDDITGLATKVIKGHNHLTGKITKMTPNYHSNGSRYVVNANASPSSQELSYDNGATKEFTLDNITANSFTVTAYDTRNLPNAKTKYIDLVEYWNPKIANFTMTRKNGIEEYATINANGTFAHWSGWSEIKQYNSIKAIYIRYRVINTGEWSNWQNVISFATVNENGNWSISGTLDDKFSVTNKYEFEMYVDDLLETSSRGYTTLSTANGFLWRDLLNKWLGINKKPTCALDVNGDVSVDGTITANDVKIPPGRADVDGSSPISFSPGEVLNNVTELKNYKTIFGGMQIGGSNAWYDIISTRHRNGAGDGQHYGMYLRTTLTSQGDLLWGKQYQHDKWQQERKILDSVNWLDIVYPVGSYYETSNTSFNPNTAWGGTWVEDTKGRVLVALDTGQTEFNSVGKTGGSKTHCHWTAYFDYNGGFAILDTSRVNKRSSGIYPPQDTGNWWFNKTGTTGATTNGSQHGVSTETALPPYTVVKRWHRTA